MSVKRAPLHRPRMLVVDRDPSVRGLVQLLVGDSFEVEQALSGILAVQMLSRQSFQYIMASLDMPSRSGYKGLNMLLKIRQVPGYQTTPLIALTSMETPTLRPQDHQDLQYAVLPRKGDLPFDASSLQTALNQARGVSRLQAA